MNIIQSQPLSACHVVFKMHIPAQIITSGALLLLCNASAAKATSAPLSVIQLSNFFHIRCDNAFQNQLCDAIPSLDCSQKGHMSMLHLSGGGGGGEEGGDGRGPHAHHTCHAWQQPHGV